MPAVLLACAGAAALGRRTVAAVLAGPSVASSAVASWGLPLLVVCWAAGAVLWDPSVVPWQPLGSRRLVPVVLPGLVLLGVWTSSWLASQAARRGASRIAVALVGGCCVLALAVPSLVTTLNPGLSGEPSVGAYSSGAAKLVSLVRMQGVGASAAYSGSLAATASLCAAIGPSASVLFVSSSTAGTFAPAVRELCGQPAAWVRAGSQSALEQAVRSVQRAGRRPVLLGPSASSVTVAGGAPRQVVSLRTSGDAEDLTGAPDGTWPVTYKLWLSLPSAASSPAQTYGAS